MASKNVEVQEPAASKKDEVDNEIEQEADGTVEQVEQIEPPSLANATQNKGIYLTQMI